MGSHADASAACYLFSFLEVLPMFGVNPYSPYGYLIAHMVTRLRLGTRGRNLP